MLTNKLNVAQHLHNSTKLTHNITCWSHEFIFILLIIIFMHGFRWFNQTTKKGINNKGSHLQTMNSVVNEHLTFCQSTKIYCAENKSNHSKCLM
jgi:hypothetical protein